MKITPELTIGIPIYNGEKFLYSKINAILKLGYEDFEIILSDNASTDKTKEICESFLKQDKRIQYIHHNKNIGPVKNFEFILKNAKGKYFMWTAVDDIILPGFIEKNLEQLQNKKIVCSVSQVEYYGEKTDKIKEVKYNGFIQKIQQNLSPLKNIPASGKLDTKIRKYLTLRGHHHVFYGIYRTEQIKNFFVNNNFSGFDFATMLNSLKFGNIFVNSDVLMYRYDGGYSSTGFFNYKKSLNLTFLQALFHYIPFSKWFLKNFGKRIFLQNLDSLIIWNLEGIFYFSVDIARKVLFSKRGYN